MDGSESPIYEIKTKEDVARLTDKYVYAVILLKSEGCGHCIEAKKSFREKAKTIRKVGLGLADFNECYNEGFVFEDQKGNKITSYPTYFMYNRGRLAGVYIGHSDDVDKAILNYENAASRSSFSK